MMMDLLLPWETMDGSFLHGRGKCFNVWERGPQLETSRDFVWERKAPFSDDLNRGGESEKKRRRRLYIFARWQFNVGTGAIFGRLARTTRAE